MLSVAESLDRESKDKYMLIIEAWDNFKAGFSTGESRNAFKQVGGMSKKDESSGFH